MPKADKDYEENGGVIFDAIHRAEGVLKTQYENVRRRGVDLLNGDHWTSEEKQAFEHYFDDEIDSLPVRNYFAQKLRHEVSLLTGDLPTCRYGPVIPGVLDQEDVALMEGLGEYLDTGFLKILRRSEYKTEAAKCILDAETQCVGWGGLIPIKEPGGGKQRPIIDRLELVQFPNRRVIFDPSVMRLRHMRWIAWGDVISRQVAYGLYPDSRKKIERENANEQSLDYINQKMWKMPGQDLLPLIHLIVLPNTKMRSQDFYGKDMFVEFDKAVHLTVIGKQVVEVDHDVPDVLPLVPLVMQPDPDDILGFPLSEIAYNQQKEIDRGVLSLAIRIADHWRRKPIIRGKIKESDVFNPERKAIHATKKGDDVEYPTFDPAVQDILNQIAEAQNALEVITGRYGASEGERPKSVTSGIAITTLASLARTSIQSKAGYLSDWIQRLGRVYLAWVKKYDKNQAIKDLGKAFDTIDVEVEIDSILQMGQEDIYRVLVDLFSVGVLQNPQLIVDHAPLPRNVRDHVKRDLMAQQERAAQVAEAAAEQRQSGMGAGGPPVVPGASEMALPVGVSLEPEASAPAT